MSVGGISARKINFFGACFQSKILTVSSSATRNGNNEKDELNNVAYEVYPNPTADQFTIDASQAVYGNYSIQDAQGKLVKEGMMNGVSTTVDLNQVARGIYFLRIADKTESIRIIKN